MKILRKEVPTIMGIVLLILLFGTAVYAIGTISTGYRINAQTSVGQKITAYDYCRSGTNSSSNNDYFIPTASEAEFDAILDNQPPGLNLGLYPITLQVQSRWNGSVVDTRNVVVPVGTDFDIGFRSTYNGGFATFNGGQTYSSTYKDDYYQIGYFFNGTNSNMNDVAQKGHFDVPMTIGHSHTYTQTGDRTNGITLSARVSVVDGCETIPTNGVCGPGGGWSYPNATEVNDAGLCASGVASPTSVSGSGPWSWSCNGTGGGSDTTCNATVGTNNPVCGSANNGSYPNAAAVNAAGLCSNGGPSPSSVSGDGDGAGWFWTCNAGGNSTFCYADSSNPSCPPGELICNPIEDF